jgi:hypothetical protein
MFTAFRDALLGVVLLIPALSAPARATELADYNQSLHCNVEASAAPSGCDGAGLPSALFPSGRNSSPIASGSSTGTPVSFAVDPNAFTDSFGGALTFTPLVLDAPEPASLTLMTIGLACLGLVLHNKVFRKVFR